MKICDNMYFNNNKIPYTYLGIDSYVFLFIIVIYLIRTRK